MYIEEQLDRLDDFLRAASEPRPSWNSDQSIRHLMGLPKDPTIYGWFSQMFTAMSNAEYMKHDTGNENWTLLNADRNDAKLALALHNLWTRRMTESRFFELWSSDSKFRSRRGNRLIAEVLGAE